MDINLDKIAQELYGKIRTRFSDVTFGDEEGKILSREEDIPNARFFEFEYKDHGEVLGTVTITLSQKKGVFVQLSGDLVDSRHPKAFKFIRSLRDFARSRLLNYDEINIGKNNLDKRDYHFQTKSKEEPMMESKMYGTAKISYQDLGEARLVVKHSQPVNTDLAAGRTQHIEAIYVENAQGERFKYPFKHLSGARALAEHLKHGGIPYDSIGKHITSLSEELAQLRKFKGYVSRNETLAEAMGDITTKVFERIEQVKKEVASLSRKSYYEQFAEAFEDREDQMIPEDIMSDWIDRLTIRTFNEELKTAFPYIFRLVDETSIPVKGLNPEDILGEDDTEGTPHSHQAKTTLKHLKKASYGDKADAANIKPGTKGFKDRYDILNRAEKEGNLKDSYNPNSVAATHARDLKAHQRAELKKKAEAGDERAKAMLKHAEERDEARRQEFDDRMERESYDPMNAFENFMDSIVNEDDESEERDNLFSDNLTVQKQAIDDLNGIMGAELKVGTNGDDVIGSLTNKHIIDDPEFLSMFKELDPDLDARAMIQQYVLQRDPGLENQLDFSGDGQVGGADTAPAPAPDAAAGAPPPPAPDAAAGAPPPPAPDAAAGAPPPPDAPPAPVAEGQDEEPPFDGPYTKAKGNITDKSGATHTGHSQAKHLAKSGMIKAIHNAKKAGAKLDTKLDFGHKEMTLHDCIEECGMSPDDFGFEKQEHEDPTHEILKSISGFWNPQEKNFTLGGTRTKIKVLKDFKDGAFPGAEPEHVKHVIDMIEKMDPSSDVHPEINHITHLAGVHHEHEIDEAGQDDTRDFNALMQQFMQNHQGANPGALLQQFQKDNPGATVTQNHTSTGTIDGKPASYDDAMAKAKGMKFKLPAMGDDDTEDEMDFSNPQAMFQKLHGKMGKMAGNMPNQTVSMPGATMNPKDMMNGIMSKIPKGAGQGGMPDMGSMMKGMNMPGMNEDAELTAMLKIAGLR